MAFNRVLIVEDEMAVAMLVEDMITELGLEVAAVVSRVEDAMEIVDSGSFDLAILDVHLNGRKVFPFADALSDRHIPFLFATGYGARDIPSRHARSVVLQKPYCTGDLKGALAKLAGRSVKD